MVAFRWEKEIDQRREQRAGHERPKRSVGAEHEKLPPPSAKGDQHRENEASRTGIRRGAWIGNHEEGEEKESAALQSVNGNGHRFVKPKRAPEDQCDPCGEEGESDICPCCPHHDQSTETSEEKGEEGDISPLAGTHPHAAIRDQHENNERECGGIEEVLVSDTKEKLRGNGNEGSEGGKPPGARSAEEAQ